MKTDLPLSAGGGIHARAVALHALCARDAMSSEFAESTWLDALAAEEVTALAGR
jgi:hypothetical protein